VEHTEAIVTILSESAHDNIRGQISEMSGTTLEMLLPAPLPAGTALRVETPDILLLCEVCSLERREDLYRTSMKVSHVLDSLLELERLNRAILGNRDATAPRGRTASFSRCET